MQHHPSDSHTPRWCTPAAASDLHRTLEVGVVRVKVRELPNRPAVVRSQSCHRIKSLQNIDWFLSPQRRHIGRRHRTAIPQIHDLSSKLEYVFSDTNAADVYLTFIDPRNRATIDEVVP